MHVEPPRQFHSPHPCVFFSGRSFVLFFFFASTMEKEKKKEVISVACKNSKRRIIRWRKPTLAYRILLLSWGPPLRVDDERPFVYRFVSSNDETARRQYFYVCLVTLESRRYSSVSNSCCQKKPRGAIDAAHQLTAENETKRIARFPILRWAYHETVFTESEKLHGYKHEIALQKRLLQILPSAPLVFAHTHTHRRGLAPEVR